MPTKSEAKLTWTGGMKFEGTSIFGHKIATDSSKKVGGNEDGYKPTELLLFGLAGCTGMDVLKILEKQRQVVTGLEIEVIGHQQDDYPKPFHKVEVRYTARGKGLDEKKVAKAIELSESKYCTVSQTVKMACEVTTSYAVIED